MSTSRSVEISFSSGRSGSALATWGQQAIWDAVQQLGDDAPRYNVSLGFPLRPSPPTDRMLDSIARLLHLHDSLHTRLSPNDAGQLEQTVDAAGRLPVAVRQGPAAADATEEVEREGRELLAELTGRAFDCAHEWPLRIGLVETEGTVGYLAFVLSHTAVDGGGLRRVVTDLLALLDGESPAALQTRFQAFQPLEEAAFQGSDRGVRQDAAARRYWRKKLQLGPERLFPEHLSPADRAPAAKFPNAVLNSPALARAVEQVAAAHRASSSSVLLAATSMMTARLSGSPDTSLQVVVNNRFLPPLTHAVSTVAQEGFFHLPDADKDLPDVLGRAHATALATYRNAYYDKRHLDQDIEQLTQQGTPLTDRSCVFNDTRILMPDQPADALPPIPLAHARTLTTLTWPTEFDPRPGLTFALDALQAPGSLELAMTADSTLIPRPDMERFLYGIEDLILTEALSLP